MSTIAKLSAILLLPCLAGCVATSPDWDANFGDAARTVAAQQVMNPEASRNRSPVVGLDGKAAQSAMSEYAKSFAQPEPQPNVLTIGVGTGGR
jgi:hypothetical protein